jgi:hypothetical protein
MTFIGDGREWRGRPRSPVLAIDFAVSRRDLTGGES